MGSKAFFFFGSWEPPGRELVRHYFRIAAFGGGYVRRGSLNCLSVLSHLADRRTLTFLGLLLWVIRIKLQLFWPWLLGKRVLGPRANLLQYRHSLLVSIPMMVTLP